MLTRCQDISYLKPLPIMYLESITHFSTTSLTCPWHQLYHSLVVRYKVKSYSKNPRGRSNQDETRSSTLSQSVQDDSIVTETKIVVHRQN
ncbi:hypothetical protein KIN20_003019 [Parelaphostrongylus tenuis]|uniref:Uncharacterized protein n=1 Tax=Parelaphostrongylus tenuis TaxID=148309 RepID=A0AAD5M0P2_PARTN|nr:hypothetical protein KIN20_003019 [Parelaphostrongylus tenuis]